MLSGTLPLSLGEHSQATFPTRGWQLLLCQVSPSRGHGRKVLPAGGSALEQLLQHRALALWELQSSAQLRELSPGECAGCWHLQSCSRAGDEGSPGCSPGARGTAQGRTMLGAALTPHWGCSGGSPAQNRAGFTPKAKYQGCYTADLCSCWKENCIPFAQAEWNSNLVSPERLWAVCNDKPVPRAPVTRRDGGFWSGWDAPSSEAANRELWAGTGMSGLGCRVCVEEPWGTNIPHWAPLQRLEEGNWSTCTGNGLHPRLRGQPRAEQRRHTQAVLPQGSDLVHTRAGSDHSSQKPGGGGNTAQRGQSCVSDSHYKNSVYCINKFTSLFLWMTSVCTTHGRHPRWSSFSVFVYNSAKRHTKCQLPNQIWAL